MFVLNPGANGGGKIGPAASELSEKLWFFGRLGIYFALVRGAYIFFSGRIEKQALKEQ